MQPDTPNQTAPLILDYRDPSAQPRLVIDRLVRCLAGVLSLAAFAMGWGAIERGWVQNGVLEFGVLLLFSVGAILGLRSAKRCRGILRAGWIGAVVVFGLWTAAILSNQFHGQPPPSDRYFIAGFGLSCILSAFALAFDPRPPAAAKLFATN